MLSRANSDAAARLRRSKSSSTVHKRPGSTTEPIDFDAIRQQALAAATTAFARAQAQDAIEHTARRYSDLSRSKSNASRKSLTSQGNHFPPRGSSFRSMKASKAEQHRDNQNQSQASVSNTEQTTEQPPCSHPMPTSGESLPVPQQLPMQPSVPLSENARPNIQQKSVRPSVASSMASQQIRKARSMYYASSIQTGSPIAKPPAMYLTITPAASISPASEPSPMYPPPGTLGRSPLTEPRIPVTVAPGVTLNEARDEYLQEFQQHSVKHKPSMFLAPFKKRQDKAKDRANSSISEASSFSVSRENTPNEPTLDTDPSDFMPQQDPKEKRSFSGSLKNRIRRVFRRTSAKPTELPVQHIRASRNYFDAPHLSPPDVADPSSIPCPDEATLQRVRGRTASFESARPSCPRTEHRSDSTGSARSLRSLHSEVNAPHAPSSRVTSWGTTSTSDTMTQRTIKRMTVIHESKDSTGSEGDYTTSVPASKRKSMPLPPLSSFRDPMPTHSLPADESNPIDPKRVFSALMREIGTSKSSQEPPNFVKPTSDADDDALGSRTAKLPTQTRNFSSSGSHHVVISTEPDQRPFSRRSVIAHSVQGKNSTIRTFGRAIRSTIRAVTPVGRNLSPDPEITNTARDAKNSQEHDDATHSTPEIEAESNQRSSSIQKWRSAAHTFIPSASQIEKRKEKSRDRWKAPLEDPNYFQFPRETDKTYDVTASGLQTRRTPDNSAEKIKSLDRRGHSTASQSPRQLPPSPKVPASPPMATPMSPSIYSRNTDGISINLNDSVMSFDGPSQLEQSHNAGSAVILTSHSVRSYTVGTPSPQREKVAHTSRDWRAWLSHEISGMELNSWEDLTINERYRKSSRRDRPDPTPVSIAGNKDTAEILRDCLDTGTSQPDRKFSTTTITSCSVGYPDEPGQHIHDSVRAGAEASAERSLYHDPSIADDISGCSSNTTASSQVRKTSQSRPDPSVSGSHLLSTYNSHKSYHKGIDTIKELPKNRQGTLTDTIRCSSSNNLASQRSESPSDNAASLSVPKSSKPIFGPVSRPSRSALPANETPQHGLITPPKRDGTEVIRKENMTPKSHSYKQSTPSPRVALPRPTPQQLLSLSTLNRNSPNTDPVSMITPGIDSTKSPPSPASTSVRPRVRVIARPISPEKRVRRPKSAFELQSTSQLETPTTLAGPNTASPSRSNPYARQPALYATPSPSSLSAPKESSHSRPGAHVSNSECTRSATPGHRMADQFLRQRNSAPGLEKPAGKRRGGVFLVREDTPAFL